MGFAALNPSYMLWPYETHHLSAKLPPRFAQPHPAKRRWQVPCDETSRNVEYGPHPADMSMFHRIEVNLIDMACEIVFVSQGVFPMSALPMPRSALWRGLRKSVRRGAARCGDFE